MIVGWVLFALLVLPTLFSVAGLNAHLHDTIPTETWRFTC